MCDLRKIISDYKELITQPLEENVRPPDRVVDSFVLKPTTPKDVMKSIKSLESKKSFGLDGITTEVLYIYDYLDKRRKCMALFIDLKKAFDTVNHKKLITNFQDIGFRGTFSGLIYRAENNA
ncbi:hypothetical protein HHI36_022287, partial [Cryptolaemus montrouzieri]